MQLFKRFFDFYINSSIHVSLSVVALSWITSLSLDINVNYHLLLFIFFATITGYNFVKYAEIAGLHHRSLTTSLRSIQIFSIICGLGLLITAFQMPLEVWVACAILGVITLLYAVPFFIPKKKRELKGNLRSVSGLKIFIIGLVWAGVTVILPLIAEGLEPDWDFWIVFVQRFLLVLALMIPFEIRDFHYDEQSLKTLPQALGIEKAKVIGLIWLCLYFGLVFMSDEISGLLILSHFFVLLVLGSLILLSRKRQSKYYASFIVEGVPLLWLLFIAIFSL